MRRAQIIRTSWIITNYVIVDGKVIPGTATSCSHNAPFKFIRGRLMIFVVVLQISPLKPAYVAFIWPDSTHCKGEQAVIMGEFFP